MTHPRDISRTTQRRAWRRPSLCWVLGISLLTAGCGGPGELEESYGQRRGRAALSVQGTSVLAGMFEQAGFKVVTWKYLSPRLQDYDVIVWTPDDFGPPGAEPRQFLEDWLAESSGRTLVFIGRDYDAVSRYWNQVLPHTPADQRVEVMRRAAQAQSTHDNRRLEMPADKCVQWFTVRRDGPRQRVTAFEGPWSKAFDASQSDIWIEGRLDTPTPEELAQSRREAEESVDAEAKPDEPPNEDGPPEPVEPPYEDGPPEPVELPYEDGPPEPDEPWQPDRSWEPHAEEQLAEQPDFEVRVDFDGDQEYGERQALYEPPGFEPQLRSEQGVLVNRVTKRAWGDSQILVVTNGSFLLNLPMINHEHRLLAGELIRACGTGGKTAFLESGPSGPFIFDSRPTAPAEMVRRRVLLAIHWFALGILVCFYLFPIFGRPKRVEAGSEADYGAHVDALGALLQETGDTQYVQQQLTHYQQIARRDTSVRPGVPAGKRSRSPGSSNKRLK